MNKLTVKELDGLIHRLFIIFNFKFDMQGMLVKGEFIKAFREVDSLPFVNAVEKYPKFYNFLTIKDLNDLYLNEIHNAVKPLQIESKAPNQQQKKIKFFMDRIKEFCKTRKPNYYEILSLKKRLSKIEEGLYHLSGMSLELAQEERKKISDQIFDKKTFSIFLSEIEKEWEAIKS